MSYDAEELLSLYLSAEEMSMESEALSMLHEGELVCPKCLSAEDIRILMMELGIYDIAGRDWKGRIVAQQRVKLEMEIHEGQDEYFPVMHGIPRLICMKCGYVFVQGVEVIRERVCTAEISEKKCKKGVPLCACGGPLDSMWWRVQTHPVRIEQSDEPPFVDFNPKNIIYHWTVETGLWCRQCRILWDDSLDTRNWVEIGK